MADGLTAAQAATLYERDFYAWTQAQATALRAAVRAEPSLDYENLAEEIESLGRRDRQEVQAKVATIIEHLLKLEASPAEAPRAGWRATIRRARQDIERSLRDSPSLRPAARRAVTEEAAAAGREAAAALADHGEEDAAAHVILMAGKHTPDQVLGDWWPETPAPGT